MRKSARAPFTAHMPAQPCTPTPEISGTRARLAPPMPPVRCVCSNECLVRLGKPEPARIVKQQLDVALARADIPIRSSCYCRMIDHAAVA